MSERVLVIGHKNPDTDTTVASIGYAYYKNQLERTDKYVARSTGELNAETQFVLDEFNYEQPTLVTNVAGEKVILVDHNEMGQVVDGVSEAQILEIIDHHRVGDLQTSAPIMFHAEPVGSSSTIVADFLMYHDLIIPDAIAGLLLAGILSDTVIFKSPTTTEKDKRVARALAKQVDLDIESFGMSVKQAKASIQGMSASEVILKDFKEFEREGYRYGIGQVEGGDYAEAIERRGELMKELKSLRVARGYKLMVLMVTNIMDEATKLWCAGDESLIEKAFNKEVNNYEVYLPGVMSRKKQVNPAIQEALWRLY